MKYHILFLIITLVISKTYCNTINPIELEKKISNLNDQHKYNDAIIIIEGIIGDKKSTSFDLYNAYLQKSYTYKRLYNYFEAKNSLELAHKHGMKSNERELVEIQVLLENLFLEFDQKNFDQTAILIKKIEKNKNNLHLITNEARAFYLSIIANIAMTEKKFDLAERYLNEGITIVKKYNPKHLPNIYRVKVELYRLSKQHEKVLDAYEKGIFYANKYNVDVYKIAMHEAITKYYRYENDYKNAFLSQVIVNDAITKYDSKNNSGKIALLEKELLEEKKKNELDLEKNYRLLLILIMVILLILALTLYELYRVTKTKKIFIQQENKRIKAELEILTQSLKEKGDNKIEINDFDLTERQKQIINLVRQGKTNKEIGNELFISENTVKYHLKIIYDILNIDNRLELK